MTQKTPQRHIASVVLNYNSDSDVMMLLPQLLVQKGIQHSAILVDNASQPACVERLRAWFQKEYPESVVGSVEQVYAWVSCNPVAAREHARVYVIFNHENRGYSAGNNIGIRLAEVLGAEAVLIANPDMRIDDQDYMNGLSKVLFADDANCIAASRILGSDGKDQNPLREPHFWEEVFWPLAMTAKLLGHGSYVLRVNTKNRVINVPKVSGCCLMLHMKFLQDTGYLDENVFLYCEEPILSARVSRCGGKIIYLPSKQAIHAHDNSDKGDAVTRYEHLVASRKYYLETYSGYSRWRQKTLLLSYGALLIFRKTIRFIKDSP